MIVEENLIVSELARATAGLVAVVSLAMIGISVRLLPKFWYRFQHYYQGLSRSEWKSALPFVGISYLPMLFLALFAVLSVKLPNYMPGLFFFVVIAITILMVLIEIGAAIKRKIKKQAVVTIAKVEIYAPAYFTALSYMALGVGLNIAALIGMSPTMLLINIGPVGPENYEWGKWCLYIAIAGFTLGIIMFGLTLALEKASERKRQGSREESESRLGNGDNIKSGS